MYGVLAVDREIRTKHLVASVVARTNKVKAIRGIG